MKIGSPSLTKGLFSDIMKRISTVISHCPNQETKAKKPKEKVMDKTDVNGPIYKWEQMSIPEYKLLKGEFEVLQTDLFCDVHRIISTDQAGRFYLFLIKRNLVKKIPEKIFVRPLADGSILSPFCEENRPESNIFLGYDFRISTTFSWFSEKEKPNTLESGHQYEIEFSFKKGDDEFELLFEVHQGYAIRKIEK